LLKQPEACLISWTARVGVVEFSTNLVSKRHYRVAEPLDPLLPDAEVVKRGCDITNRRLALREGCLARPRRSALWKLEMFDVNCLTTVHGKESQCADEQIMELPNVSWIAICHQRHARRVSNARHPYIRLLGSAFQETVNQGGECSRSIPQRGQLQSQHIEAFKEILTKAVIVNVGFKIAERRRNNAHINRDHLLASNPTDLPVIEEAKQSGL
jgi:hypothetical protein